MTAETDCNIGIDKPAKTIVKKVGCGNLYIIICEHHNGHFDRLIIKGSMTRFNDCGSSYTDVLASVCSFGIRRALEEDSEGNYKDFKHTVLFKGIISQMIGKTCYKQSMVTETSCASAIGFTIKDYVMKKRKE